MNMHGTWEADFDGQLQDGKDRVECNGVELANVKDEDVLICCPTIRGFSFNKKLFRFVSHCHYRGGDGEGTPRDGERGREPWNLGISKWTPAVPKISPLESKRCHSTLYFEPFRFTFLSPTSKTTHLGSEVHAMHTCSLGALISRSTIPAPFDQIKVKHQSTCACNICYAVVFIKSGKL
ncbi:hypothetical protein CIHG_05060 [Coccidioides immitis H538.4]|uniref:Uncharacterized protein n=1 Tax=Coccidioides immitis H538.4 TaxID=396776 RepID=A0A0J8RPV4_COCIT|nr:hypothetical protein CIHG_05060 [Coccidioides immitis H538.4]